MTIKKSANGWLVDVQPAGRGGKRFRKTLPTKAEALRWETWIKSQVAQEPEWQPARRDIRHLSELVETWWEHAGQGLRNGAKQRATLLNFALAIGNPVADRFDAEDFSAYRKSRLEQGISPNTVNRVHAYCRSMFNELRRLKKWDRENPLREVRQLRVVEVELGFLTGDDIRLLLGTFERSGHRDALLVSKVCLATGARWSEAEGLGRTQVRHGAIHLSGTKSGKNRSIPISAGLEAELLAQVVPGSDRLFKGCYNDFRDAVIKAELKLPDGQLTHVLRHTFASHFMMNGGNILVLQRILGHSTLAMTMRYAHFAPDHLQEARLLNPLAALTLG
ncbi:phage integrase [Jeongeupia chitinilytica]|uniref:Integrase n=1 Tax=Jeongeupia chitinilytica TaxID=1041641 RepID=A0ABQ3H1U4_9NEIS|nr:tyrosine-type recombinase/integrase [Jeongeupia chitinilytica]GHD66109.1 integrase [Jeongeupia chitinilytica]